MQVLARHPYAVIGLAMLAAALIVLTEPHEARVATTGAAVLRAAEGDVLLWRSAEGLAGCAAEKQATGKAGPICLAALLARTPSGTPARYVENAGPGLVRVQVLDGPSAGTLAVVERARFGD